MLNEQKQRRNGYSTERERRRRGNVKRGKAEREGRRKSDLSLGIRSLTQTKRPMMLLRSRLVPERLESLLEGLGDVFVLQREEVHSSFEGRHSRQLISLLLLECARAPTSYSSNVVVVDGGFSGNADISSTI